MAVQRAGQSWARWIYARGHRGVEVRVSNVKESPRWTSAMEGRSGKRELVCGHDRSEDLPHTRIKKKQSLSPYMAIHESDSYCNFFASFFGRA